MERERKYLVKDVPPNLRRYPHQRIEQGYLPIAEKDVEVRVRRTGGKAVLTIKRGSGHSRQETELPLPSKFVRSLWSLTKGRRIAKTRYRIPHGRLTIEVDVYHGLQQRGLMTAEVEFTTLAALKRFERPAWFGREVTGDSKWSNRRLAS